MPVDEGKATAKRPAGVRFGFGTESVHVWLVWSSDRMGHPGLRAGTLGRNPMPLIQWSGRRHGSYVIGPRTVGMETESKEPYRWATPWHSPLGGGYGAGYPMAFVLGRGL
jgi:hypothetical protein